MKLIILLTAILLTLSTSLYIFSQKSSTYQEQEGLQMNAAYTNVTLQNNANSLYITRDDKSTKDGYPAELQKQLPSEYSINQTLRYFDAGYGLSQFQSERFEQFYYSSSYLQPLNTDGIIYGKSTYFWYMVDSDSNQGLFYLQTNDKTGYLCGTEISFTNTDSSCLWKMNDI